MVAEIITELNPKDNPHIIPGRFILYPILTGDINTLKQVWVNLISNAIKIFKEHDTATH